MTAQPTDISGGPNLQVMLNILFQMEWFDFSLTTAKADPLWTGTVAWRLQISCHSPKPQGAQFDQGADQSRSCSRVSNRLLGPSWWQALLCHFWRFLFFSLFLMAPQRESSNWNSLGGGIPSQLAARTYANKVLVVPWYLHGIHSQTPLGILKHTYKTVGLVHRASWCDWRYSLVYTQRCSEAFWRKAFKVARKLLVPYVSPSWMAWDFVWSKFVMLRRAGKMGIAVLNCRSLFQVFLGVAIFVHTRSWNHCQNP